MNPRLKICAVTGARSDYGLLRPILEALAKSDRLALQLVAAGMHLAPEFGLTVREIEADGFRVDERVEMLLASDTPVGTAKAIGLGTIGFADVLARLDPDLLLILGDRFEILAAGQAALVARLPIAHVMGGDTTEGAIDEAIRHSLTKMSHLHFVAHEQAARRVRQLGESPDRIHTVGNPALDLLARTALLARGEVEQALGFKLRPRNLLVTFHPATLEAEPAEAPFGALLAALDRLGPETGLIFTLPNADPFGRVIIRMIEGFVAARGHAVARASLGQLRYWSTLAMCDAVVGNSSSGLLEAPSLGKPAVNIGDRQAGRPRAASVVDCAPEAAAIGAAIDAALRLDCRGVVNPYGDGRAVPRIMSVLERLDDPRALIKKRFADLERPA